MREKVRGGGREGGWREKDKERKVEIRDNERRRDAEKEMGRG